MTTATLVHRYQPHGTARTVFECRDPEVLMSGPAGTGKSRACLEKLHMMALANPKMRGLIVRKTLASLGSTALVTWREHVAKEALEAGVVVWYGGSAQEAPGYRYSNGSLINVGGMDKATRIMSSEYDVVYAQEAIELTEDDWEAITTRLRNGKVSFQQLIADTNPSVPTHWLKSRCDRGATTFLDCRHQDNPTLYQDGKLTPIGEAYLAKLNALTGVRKQRLLTGRWVAAEGQIYDTWDPDLHLIDQRELPPDWPRYWSVDFGFTNPFVLQCWALDPDGRLILYREIYRTRTLVEDHARTILRAVRRCTDCCDSKAASHDCHDCEACHLEWTEPKPRAVICDHDAEDRATLEKHLSMSTVPARKGVSNGIQSVQTRLKPAGDGRPRLLIMRDALLERDTSLEEAKKPCSTEQEVVGYAWAPPLPGRPPKETPLKEDDHGCDALRYMVADRDMGARPGVRWM